MAVAKVVIVTVAVPAVAEVGNGTRVWYAVTVVTVAMVATVANAVP